MITLLLCIIYVFSAVLVYRNIRSIYWAFMIDDALTTFKEWCLVLLPIVNTIYLIYTECIKYRNKKWLNKN